MRDSARGKGVVVEEEVPIEVRMGPVEFNPAEGFLRHEPVSKGDFAEFVDDAMLAQLLRENLAVVAAREERQRTIALAQEEERLRDEAKRARVEGEDALREMEAAERARAEAELPRVPAATVAAGLKRGPFSATAYVPLTPHLFVPLGFQAYKPQRPDYDAELVLRDPETHISRTWIEVATKIGLHVGTDQKEQTLADLELEGNGNHSEVASKALEVWEVELDKKPFIRLILTEDWMLTSPWIKRLRIGIETMNCMNLLRSNPIDHVLESGDVWTSLSRMPNHLTNDTYFLHLAYYLHFLRLSTFQFQLIKLPSNFLQSSFKSNVFIYREFPKAGRTLIEHCPFSNVHKLPSVFSAIDS
ncbi:hypothetical protein RHMOL_Rhmol05G0168700 [Rhododendron molle]|uniref:Uncharacterized protein n=1 Tax=Rhododendron molle TaxID=49168 RepID=A0ACC0NQX9_RHOML|nr:hypothetical protein RHMOL_Rhmol05G0168700 [Rhododendron molle]